MEEACRLPVGVAADHEDRVLTLEPEERVDRHHEALLHLVAAPGACDRFEPGSQFGADLPRVERLDLVAGSLEARYRLADLADRAAIERESRGGDDCLVSMVERVQAVLAVEIEPHLGRSEDGDAPVACVSEDDEALDEPAE